jgi:hypothetical protein
VLQCTGKTLASSSMKQAQDCSITSSVTNNQDGNDNNYKLHKYVYAHFGLFSLSFLYSLYSFLFFYMNFLWPATQNRSIKKRNYEQGMIKDTNPNE